MRRPRARCRCRGSSHSAVSPLYTRVALICRMLKPTTLNVTSYLSQLATRTLHENHIRVCSFGTLDSENLNLSKID